MINELKQRVLCGGEISLDEAVALAETADLDALCEAADEIRKKFCGDKIDTCSIINARSGLCGEDCKWCSQSKHFATGVVQYEIVDTQRMLDLAKAYDQYGVKRFSLVTSGRRVSLKDANKFCDDYRQLQETTGLRLCASMGLVDKETLQKLKDAGVERYHCNMETSAAYFKTLCSTHTPDDKRRTIEAAKEVGMTVCSGGIIGMGETMRQRLEMAFELREMGVNSVPINVLNPIPGTPLEHTPLISDEEIVRTVAVYRFILPDKVLRFAGGRARLPRATVERILRGGMNGAMIGDLLTTTGNDEADDFRLFRECGFDVERN